MKSRWESLELREKRIVGLGFIFLTVFLIYEILFTPLLNSVDSLRQKMHNNQKLLSWMKATDQEISSYTSQEKNTSPQSSVSLLNLIQIDINKQNFSKNVVELKQSENNSVELKLQKVHFDTFIQWLNTFSKSNQILISELNITPVLNNPGEVTIQLKMQTSY